MTQQLSPAYQLFPYESTVTSTPPPVPSRWGVSLRQGQGRRQQSEAASNVGPSRSLTGGRSTTVFKCVATPGVKWCHVLQRADFEAKTSPNLVPRVAKWWNVWPHLGHISEAADC